MDVELGSFYVSKWSGHGYEVLAVDHNYVVLQCVTTGRQRETQRSWLQHGLEFWFVCRSATRETQALIDQAAPFQY